MPAVYAEQMVERGFAAFTFDFRGWGKSGDLPQNISFFESPEAKTSDNSSVHYTKQHCRYQWMQEVTSKLSKYVNF